MPTRPELVGDFGMVASTHWLASATGMSVLERGGNAADAAVAAGFVLQVVEPHLNGPGGEVPALVYSPTDDRVHVVDGQGTAPAAATIERFTDLGLDLVPGTGLLAATVPGAFGGWLLLLERWGSWPLRDVVEYAVSYAERGWPILESTCRTIATTERLFRDEWPTSAHQWLADGVPAPGRRTTNRALAATYRRVVAEAEAASSDREGQLRAALDTWYGGFVAAEIAAFSAADEVADVSGRRHRGLLTADDLAGWRAGVEDPATFDYGEYRVCKSGPWGQGPVFLQQLALVAGCDLATSRHLSAEWIHTLVECAKLAFADREAWYGDPRFVDVPTDALLAQGYSDARRRLVTDRASLELRPGSPDGHVPTLPPLAVERGMAGPPSGVGEPTVDARGATRGDTCHVDTVDRDGLMVSATPSGGWLQSSPTIPTLGFCLGTRAQMFWLTPGLASSLRPRARPRTTLSPSFAFRDGRPWLAFGTPGGDQQDQWALNFFLSVVHGRLGLQAAVDAPMFHTTSFPASFFPRETNPGQLVVEDRVDPAVVVELRRRGHDVTVVDGWSLGRISAVARDDDGFLRAAANPRGAQGYAAGR